MVSQVLIQQTEDRASTGRTHTNEGPPVRGSVEGHVAPAATATVAAAPAMGAATPAAAIKQGASEQTRGQRASEGAASKRASIGAAAAPTTAAGVAAPATAIERGGQQGRGRA
jgi:hypothetical protein